MDNVAALRAHFAAFLPSSMAHFHKTLGTMQAIPFRERASPAQWVYHLETLLYDQVIGLHLVAYPLQQHRPITRPLPEACSYHPLSALVTVGRIVRAYWTGTFEFVPLHVIRTVALSSTANDSSRNAQAALFQQLWGKASHSSYSTMQNTWRTYYQLEKQSYRLPHTLFYHSLPR